MPGLKSRDKYKIEEFTCRRCGNCCKGDGIVNLLEEDIRAAAKYLQITRDNFLQSYTTVNESGERWLIDKFVAGEQWCVFLERDEQCAYRCRIQQAKPEQCTHFPFKWRSKDAVQWCEGLKG